MSSIITPIYALLYKYTSIWKDTKLNRFTHILFISHVLYKFLS